MYINTYELPKPPDHLLALCTKVELDGEGKRMWEMKRWCHDQDLSLVWAEQIDMSDISSWPGPDDYIKFYFIDAEDATMFTLKYK